MGGSLDHDRATSRSLDRQRTCRLCPGCRWAGYMRRWRPLPSPYRAPLGDHGDRRLDTELSGASIMLHPHQLIRLLPVVARMLCAAYSLGFLGRTAGVSVRGNFRVAFVPGGTDEHNCWVRQDRGAHGRLPCGSQGPDGWPAGVGRPPASEEAGDVSVIPTRGRSNRCAAVPASRSAPPVLCRPS